MEKNYVLRIENSYHNIQFLEILNFSSIITSFKHESNMTWNGNWQRDIFENRYLSTTINHLKMAILGYVSVINVNQDGPVLFSCRIKTLTSWKLIIVLQPSQPYTATIKLLHIARVPIAATAAKYYLLYYTCMLICRHFFCKLLTLPKNQLLLQ